METAMTTDAYAVWLDIAGDQGKTIQGIIDELTTLFFSPRFVAHITLLGLPGPKLGEGEIKEYQEACAALAAEVNPFEVTLYGLNSMANPFQALFLPVWPSDQVTLWHLNERARQRFGRTGDPPYMPHASLAYGVQDRLLADVVRNLWQRFPRRATIDHLSLWDCHGTPQAWQLIARYALTR